MIPFMVDPNWYWLYWYEPHKAQERSPVANDDMYAWHGGERDSGRFTAWLAEWKQSRDE